MKWLISDQDKDTLKAFGRVSVGGFLCFCLIIFGFLLLISLVLSFAFWNLYIFNYWTALAFRLTLSVIFTLTSIWVFDSSKFGGKSLWSQKYNNK